jgi:hypothetical protein
VRSDEDIIEELKKIILSCQRDKFFTIKVLDFRVVDDYKEINDVLYNYEEAQNNKGNNEIKLKKRKRRIFINLFN